MASARDLLEINSLSETTCGICKHGELITDIGKEIAPGVPWTFCQSDGYDVALTLKSGNFGAEGFFTDAQRILASL